MLDSKRNLYFAPFAALLLWTTQLAFALEAWRRATGPAIRGWLEAVAQLEALGALATYAAENPEDPFPEVVPDGPCLDAEGLGHPLLPADRCVRNDEHLNRAIEYVEYNPVKARLVDSPAAWPFSSAHFRQGR